MKNGKLKLSLLITISALILLMLIPLCAHAEGETILNGSCGENVYFVLDSEGTLTVSGTGEMTDYSERESAPWLSDSKSIKKVVIQKGVTSVGNYAFRSCSELTDVVVEDGVESIGDSSFNNCQNIKNIDIADSVSSIGAYSFSGCQGLESFDFPSGLKKIGNYAFVGWSSLKKAELPEGLESMGTNAFECCFGLTEVSIPSTLTEIGNNSFNYCEALRTVDIADLKSWCSIEFGMTKANPLSIAEEMKVGGVPITELVIPEGTEIISAYAFYNASFIKSVSIPSTIKQLGHFCFYGCENIEILNINDIANWCGAEIVSEKSNPLYYAQRIAVDGVETDSIVIPEGVSKINDYAFNQLISVRSLTIPKSAVEFEIHSFSAGTALTDVYYGGTAAQFAKLDICNTDPFKTTVMHCADVTMDNILGTCGENIVWGFRNNALTIHGSGEMYEFSSATTGTWRSYRSSIYSATISGDIVNIGNEAFLNCKNLKSITIPDGIGRIGKYAFKGCSSLTQVTLPKNLSSLGVNCFENCTALKSITVPVGVTEIGDNTFYNCTSLSKLTAQGLKTVGKYAFYGCGALNYIKLSADISEIGENAFPANGNLVDVYYGGTYKQWSALSVAQGNEGILKACVHASDASNSKAVPLRTISLGKNSIALDWEESEGSEFFVYRSESKSGPYTLIGTDPNSNVYKYVDKTAEHGKTYYYRVVNYDVIGSRLVYFSSKTVGGRTDVTKPKLTVSRDGFTSLKLTWKAVDGAAGYKVYRYSSGTYKLIATVKGKTSYIDGSLKPSAYYSYKIKAYSVKDGVAAYSDFSVNDAEVVIATAPEAFKPVSAGYTSIKLTWNKVSGASGYEILRSTSKTGTFSKIKTVTSGSTLSYTDTSLSCGKTYYYKIRAYMTANGKKTYGDYSSIASAKPVPAKTSVSLKKASSSSIKVSWSKVSGASGYEVYRSASKTGSYSKVKTVTSGATISYTNTSLSKGKTYYYKVRAYRTVYGKKVYGAFSTGKSLKLS